MSRKNNNELEFDTPFDTESDDKTSRTRVDRGGVPLVPPPPVPRNGSMLFVDEAELDEDFNIENPSQVEDSESEWSPAGEDKEADKSESDFSTHETDFDQNQEFSSQSHGSPLPTPAVIEDAEHFGWRDNVAYVQKEEDPTGRAFAKDVERDVIGLDARSEAGLQFQNDQSLRDHELSQSIALSLDSGEFLSKGMEESFTDGSIRQFDLPMSLEEASIRLDRPDLIDSPVASRLGSHMDAQDNSMRNTVPSPKGPVVTMSTESLDFSGSEVIQSSATKSRKIIADEAIQHREEKSWIQKASEQTQTHVLPFPFDSEEESPVDHLNGIHATRLHAAPRHEDFEIPSQVDRSTAAMDMGLSTSASISSQSSPSSRSDQQVLFLAVIESRNTKTRLVELSGEEFSLAERQILENRLVHIPGKALVLDAVAITRQISQDVSRRRNRSRAA